MKFKLKRSLVLGLLFISVQGFSQLFNYTGIDVQGQIKNATSSTVSLNFQIIDLSSGIMWEEEHINVPIYDQNTYQLTFGQGTYLGGTETSFENINWFNVDRVEIRRSDAGPAYLVGTYELLPLPYSFHSITCANVPFTFDLTDNITSSPDLNWVIRFDGTQFFAEEEWLGDTALFAYYSGTTAYADTVDFAYSPNTADSALLAFYADTAGYAVDVDSSIYADTAFYADTAGVALYALNNWGILGNAATTVANYVGTSDAQIFNFGTNNNFRLRFGVSENIYSGTEYPGFSLDPNEGALFEVNTTAGILTTTAPFLYYGGLHRGFTGGENAFSLDTAMGDYCVVWGKDNATNGPNSTIFGLNNIADSTQIGATTYAAISSFAAGRGNRVSRMGVAIGDSCVADYYRSVAIGKNAIATNLSATTAVGWNVLSTGATAWALGKNVTANGNYSTVTGTNASSDGFTGTFVWGDNSTVDTVRSTAAHQFMARASGGFIFYSSLDLSAGAELAAGGGSWLIISDRNKKRNIKRINRNSFSENLTALPISKWMYRGQQDLHIGPMAQDFYSAFNIGESNKHINMVDFHGVTFMGIKQISERLNKIENSNEKEDLKEEIAAEKEELEELKKRIEALDEKIHESENSGFDK